MTDTERIADDSITSIGTLTFLGRPLGRLTHDPRIRAVVSAPALGFAFGSLSSASLSCLHG
jgi:hypothetical protein